MALLERLLAPVTNRIRPVIVRKESPFQFPEWRNNSASWRMYDAATFAEEGFSKNSLYYTAIMFKARNAIHAPIRAYTGKRDAREMLPDNHPLQALWRRPNYMQGQAEFMMLAHVYFNVAGNCFTFLDRDTPNELPKGMYHLRPDRMSILFSGKELIGYKYYPEGGDAFHILPDQIMHVKLPNPMDPYEGFGFGLSPIAPSAQTGDVDNHITTFIKLFFEHGAMQQKAVKFKQSLTDKQAADARRRFREKYGGFQKWSEVTILDNDGEIINMQTDFDKMGFEQLDRRNEPRIYGPLGVPEELLPGRGNQESSTYNNKAEARRVYWEDTKMPEDALFVEEYSYYLTTTDGAWLANDYTQVPALRKDIKALSEAAKNFFEIGVPLNKALNMVGIKEEVPGGDIVYVPSSFTPMGEDPAKTLADKEKRAEELTNQLTSGTQQQPPQDTEEDEDEENEQEQNKSISPTTLKQWADYHKAIDDVAVSYETTFRLLTRQRFEAERRGLLAILSDAQGKAYANKATLDWGFINTETDRLLAESGDEWRSVFRPYIGQAMTSAGEELNWMMGSQFNIPPIDAMAWFDDYMLEFAQPITETTSAAIHDLIAQGMEEGWSVQTTQQHLSQIFDQYMQGELSAEDFEWFNSRMPPYRTEMIVRTETIRAANAGTHNLMNEWGVKSRTWSAAMDDRTRPTHANANGQSQPMDQPFEVGGSLLMYPCDTSLGASLDEIISCRCTTYPDI